MEVIMGEKDKAELKEVYPVHERVRKISYIKSREEYEKLQQQFLADPPGEKRGDKAAIQWVGNEPNEERAITYRELHKEVCKFANVLKAHGIKKGDRVCIYMPMVPETGVAMLACARIGAVHTVVFGGFSSEALSVRIQDSQAKILVVCDGTFRGAKAAPQKKDADNALKA